MEVYSKGAVQGAMVLAEVDKDVEAGNNLRKYTSKASDYLIIEATKEEYVASASGDSSIYDTKQYLKEHNMKMTDFPISEFFEQDGVQMVRSFVPVKM